MALYKASAVRVASSAMRQQRRTALSIPLLCCDHQQLRTRPEPSSAQQLSNSPVRNPTSSTLVPDILQITIFLV